MYTIGTMIRPVFILLALLTLLTGGLYPLAVSGLANLLWPWQAEGSLIVVDGRTVGSELLAQPLDQPQYFWPRPSACAYNGAGSSGSNLAVGHRTLADQAQERLAALQAAGPVGDGSAPVELVTASGSGLDPHLSPRAADWQAPRVASARGIALERVRTLIASHIQPRPLGVLGEPVVNVLRLNLALDSLPAKSTIAP